MENFNIKKHDNSTKKEPKKSEAASNDDMMSKKHGSENPSPCDVDPAKASGQRSRTSPTYS